MMSTNLQKSFDPSIAYARCDGSNKECSKLIAFCQWRAMCGHSRWSWHEWTSRRTKVRLHGRWATIWRSHRSWATVPGRRALIHSWWSSIRIRCSRWRLLVTAVWIWSIWIHNSSRGDRLLDTQITKESIFCMKSEKSCDISLHGLFISALASEWQERS